MTDGAGSLADIGCRRSPRPTRLRLAAAACLGLTVLGGLAATGAGPVFGTAFQERALAQAWHRAVDAAPDMVQTFERENGPGNLHPASTVQDTKPLVVGERVMLLTPDGTIHTLRVCDPASPTATTAADCVNAFVARAVTPVVTPTPHRSL